MAFHHLAFATRDLDATHRFYTEAMGFELVRVEAGKTPEGGWAKHLFYAIGDGECIAFWDLHDDAVPEFSAAISTGLGLPIWVNHVAFKAVDLGALEQCKKRWLQSGNAVSEVDHGWCRSIYALDPNQILVEWCTSTREFDAEDRRSAAELLRDPNPPVQEPKPVLVTYPDGRTEVHGG